MASSSAGSRLHCPKNATSIGYQLPKIGDTIARKSPHKDLKDRLMKLFGKAWNQANIEGTVVSIDKGKQYRIKWQVGEDEVLLDHGKTFFKVPKQKDAIAAVGEIAGPVPGGSPEPEEREGGRAGREEDDGNDASDGDGGEVEPDNGLHCKFQGEVLKWEILPDGVPICPRAAAGVVDRLPQVIWPQALSEARHRVPQECMEMALPMDFLMGEEGSRGWTNESLPSNMTPFSEFEFMQCLGVLVAKCLVDGAMKDLWKQGAGLLLPPFNLGGRFGLSRDRFHSWAKYVKFAPAEAMKTKAWRVSRLIDAFNAQRRAVFREGSGIIIDESISQYRPFFENMPGGIEWLVKMIRKPVGIGAEIKNTACARTGVMLFLELQVRSANCSQVILSSFPPIFLSFFLIVCYYARGIRLPVVCNVHCVYSSPVPDMCCLFTGRQARDGDEKVLRQARQECRFGLASHRVLARQGHHRC